MKKFNNARRILDPFCIVLSAFCIFLTAHGEINVPARDATAKPPPQAVPATARVRIGGAVEIPLRVYGNETEIVRFKFKTQPKFGKISGLRMVDNDTAVVTYQNGGDDGQLRDRFSYTVQATSGVSAPAEVTITIFDDPPILAVPDEIDFGSVLVGSPSMREATIENRGGGVIEGRIEPPAHWKIEGGANYRLRRGERATFCIVCRAPDEIPMRGDLRYSSHMDRVTTLRASGKMPLSVSPQLVELKTIKGDSQREGAFQISNRTNKPIPIRILGTKRLEVAELITVPPEGDISVPVRTSRDDLDPINEQIGLESPGLTMQIAVRAAAVGPILRANPKALSLGSMDFEKPGSATVTVENIGGLSGFFRVEVPPPFQIAREDAAFPLDARGKRDVRVTIQPSETGKFRAWLSIKSQSGSVELPVEAEIRNRGAASAPAAADSTAIPASPNEPSPTPGTIVAHAGGVPPVRGASLKKVTRTSAALEWQAPPGDRLQYKLESQQVSLDSARKLSIHWIPLTNIEFRQPGKTVSATVKNLTPGSPYVIRVISMNAQGEMSKFASELHFQTRPPMNFFKVTPMRILLVALAVLIAFILRQRFAPKKSTTPRPLTTKL